MVSKQMLYVYPYAYTLRIRVTLQESIFLLLSRDQKLNNSLPVLSFRRVKTVEEGAGTVGKEKETEWR